MKKESINYQQQQQQQYHQQLIHQQDQQQQLYQQQQPFYQQQGNEVIQSNQPSSPTPSVAGGGRFDFDDGGVYVGGWQDGKAHGHGICTGPKGQGEYSGSFSFGFEICGVYKWPSGAIFEGQWSNGKRHGCGVEYRGKWVYKGEWTQGYKGRYGVRASLLSSAKYEGTWANGLQDGYGSETYADSGTYQGQWLRGMRHGYGVRSSAPYGHCNVTKAALIKNQTNLSIQSLDTEGETDSTVFDSVKRDSTMRGGFVLVVKSSSSSTTPTGRRRHNSLGDKTSPSPSSNQKTGFLRGLRLKKQKSTGDIDLRSNRSSSSSVASSIDSASSAPLANKHLSRDHIDPDTISNSSFLSQDGDISDPSTTETYMGEWKNDKRSGFGICERSDGLRYEGEWYNNKKYGYGVTFFRDGSREEGKYKNNCLVTNAKKKHLFVLRSSKLRERIESAVAAARQAQQIALQKADIAISRTATARSKAEQSDSVAAQSRIDSALGYKIAKQYGGSDIAHSLSQPDAPLRGRLSNFPSIRRGNRSGDHSVSGSRQYLDVNEPFGGRRGSFRTGSNPSIAGGGGNQDHHHQLSSSSPSPTSSYNYQQSQHSSSLQFTTGNNQGSNRGPNQMSHHDSQQYLHQNQHHQHPPIQQQIYINREAGPLNDHLDQYSKLVSRYGKQSKPPLPDDVLQNRFSRSPNVVSANLDKVYGTSTAASSIDSGRESGDQSDSGLKLPPVIDMSSDLSKTPMRTASLYRLPTSTTNSGSTGAARGGGSSASGGGGGGGPLKRKPSLQSISSKTTIKDPVMSREEVSALSHATREQRRQEAEMAERLAHNPLLYFVDPRFKDWLNRQQIIIAVILINITLAIIFFKLLG